VEDALPVRPRDARRLAELGTELGIENSVARMHAAIEVALAAPR
jgi:hypothetical protein